MVLGGDRMHFSLYFFKEKSRSIDLKSIFSFFEAIPECKIDFEDERVVITYLNDTLKNFGQFIITKKSCVPNIYMLDPKYLDLNFHFEMPIMTAHANALAMFKLSEALCKKFGFAIYNELFENVLPFRPEVVERVFEMVKRAYIDKNYDVASTYFYVSRDVLSDILQYHKELYDLQLYYKDDRIYVPRMLILKDTEKNKLALGFEWKEHTATVFPPHVDYIFYRYGDDVKIIKMSEAFPEIDKMTDVVPGFIENTRLTQKKMLKKIHRIVKKTKFSKVETAFEKLTLDRIMDQ